MGKEKIISAITSAISLLNKEVDSIDYKALQDEYLMVIAELETALTELTQVGL